MWQEERRVSHYAANLEQLDTGRVIPSDPSLWKCDETGVTENLWLNLSTGCIGSGRQVGDGSGCVKRKGSHDVQRERVPVTAIG